MPYTSRRFGIILVLLVALLACSCGRSFSRREAGGVIGGGAGAGLGSILGGTPGAIIGGAAGAYGGSEIAHETDPRRRR